MALAFGNKVISKVYFGGKVVSAIYLGTKKVFPEEEEEYLPGTGDIRLRIRTTSANQSFPLFYRIMTEEGGYVSVDWGDGNKETLTGKTTYQPTHTYATAGEYTVKLTGSKFTGVNGVSSYYDDFQDAVREILSLKMPTDSVDISLDLAFYGCVNLTCNIPAWDDCITSAIDTYYGCSGLWGSIPAWGTKITNTSRTYYGCSGLWGSIPKWGANIMIATSTYNWCGGLIGNIPAWGADIKSAQATYSGCTGLTGSIPAWGANITNASSTYNGCSGLTGCSEELLQDPMPSKITEHYNCVSGCADEIRQHFTWAWGGTKEELPGTGDIRLRIETTSANQFFKLFYQITTEEGGYVSVNWGDGNEETFTGETTYQPEHTYATAGEYIVKLTGSKFTEVAGVSASVYHYFQDAVKEILSLKMPTDSTSVSLYRAFVGCRGLTGSIPEWGPKIKDATFTYSDCTGLTGNIPEWGMNVWFADYTYWGCTGLTGSIPAWGTNITNAYRTYKNCTGLTGCSWGLLQDPMPSRITSHTECVTGCVDEIRQHFTEDWGGTKTS